MFSSKDIFLGKGGAGGYQISRSVRLRSSASAYFNRTLSTPTSNTTWTLSCWLKRGALSNGGIFAESTGYAGIYFASDKIRVMDNAGSVALETTAVYRDPSAWAHLVVRSNGTNIKAYWNSVEVGSYTGTITLLNAATSHFIGRYSSNYFDGYLTEINFIDGQALTPSSFGATNATTGVWGPAAYTGTYGTNGFYLNFSDNSNNTAATIGKDSSGNGNNWTPNNISVTAGATYDSMVDTPTPYGSDSGVGGEVRGNYAVLNPIVPATSFTPKSGNLDVSATGTFSGSGIGTVSTIAVTGSCYFEITLTTNSNANAYFGVSSNENISNATGYTSTSWAFAPLGSGAGNKYTNSSSTAFAGGSYTANGAGVVFGVAVDAPNGRFYVRDASGWINGTSVDATPTTAVYTGLPSTLYPAIGMQSGTSQTVAASINFGQRAFSYTAPTGFKALNTQNLSTPTVNNGANYMAATLYTGNGSTGQSITNTVNSISFAPDFAWVKVRSTAGTDHYLADTVRGATKYLQSDTTAAEGTNNGITAFNSNGFSVGAVGDTNTNGATIVGWQWKAGGTAVTNNDGSVTSTVSANPTAGFSIITYSTPASGNWTVGHGLGVAPAFFMQKERNAATNWSGYHVSIGATKSIQLNTTSAAITNSVYWNNTAPTSSVITIGSGFAGSYTEVIYAFAPIAGYSAFGSYTGNGSADGTFVYLGFRPRFVLMKSSTLVTNWWIIDTSRNTYNVANALLTPSNNYAEDTTYNVMDVTSNGFKIRTTYTGVNSSGDTYIYAAFAENPFKYALAR
jgi:hypothetical protein